jgi:hypothetical protein
MKIYIYLDRKEREVLNMVVKSKQGSHVKCCARYYIKVRSEWRIATGDIFLVPRVIVSTGMTL